ncbi:MAG: polysaccharide biosynthesis protein [Lachnospiraceae bacterium]|nr:polysaccharide biosynthesis protein [Lachnospiraceae bacterium]
MKKESKNNFILQAGIMAAAGIIVRIIGILYRSPLVAIIGDEGNGYYNTAYNIYTIILLVSSYSIPSAISKVMAARLGLGQYRNAHRLFIGALIYVFIVGGIASLFCFTCADKLVGHNSAMVLRVFSPTIFFSGFLGCLRGYFQAHKSLVETSVSQIIEQILNAIVSITAAYFLMASVIDKTDTVRAIYGAIGSALGTGSGVLIALIFVFTVYLHRRKDIMGRIKEDEHAEVLSAAQTAKILISMVTPIVLSTCIYNLSTASNLKIYQTITQKYQGMDEATSTTLYGLFSGKAMQIINIPVAIATAMSSALIPVISSSYERKEYDITRTRMASAIRVTMLIAIPACVGLFVLSNPVTMLLYPQKASLDTVSLLIKVLAIAVVLYCLSTLSNGMLQGTGFVNRPVVHAAIALVVQALLLVFMLFKTDLGLYSLCLANVIYSLLMCIMNGRSLRTQLGYIQEIKKTFILPSISALIMGVIAWGINLIGRNTYLYLFKKDELNWYANAMILIVVLLISVLIYGILLIKLKALDEESIEELPKGKTLIRIFKKMRLLQ